MNDGQLHGTAKEALRELTVLEAKPATLIGQLDLRIVPDRLARKVLERMAIESTWLL
jgi:hypothetical protein